MSMDYDTGSTPHPRALLDPPVKCDRCKAVLNRSKVVEVELDGETRYLLCDPCVDAVEGFIVNVGVLP